MKGVAACLGQSLGRSDLQHSLCKHCSNIEEQRGFAASEKFAGFSKPKKHTSHLSRAPRAVLV